MITECPFCLSETLVPNGKVNGVPILLCTTCDSECCEDGSLIIDGWYESGVDCEPSEDDEFSDPYDQYEDYVLETGHDPFHMFDDSEPHTRLNRLKGRFLGLLIPIWARLKRLSRSGLKSPLDDIPF